MVIMNSNNSQFASNNFDSATISSAFKDILEVENVVTVNNSVLSFFLNNIICQMSTKELLTADELTIVVPATVSLDDISTVTELLLYGTKLFDAILFFSLTNRNVVKKIDVKPDYEKSTLSKLDIGKSLFVLYFHLLTRANVPEGDGTATGKDIPKFLGEVLNYKMSGNQVCKNLASFNLRKLSHEWIKSITINKFASISINRLSLGVAGYRLINIFKYLKPKENLDPALLEAYLTIRQLATTAYCWEIHPLTRSPKIMAKFGPLSKNIENVMSLVFDDKLMDELKANKVIYNKPRYDSTTLHYLNYDRKMIPELKEFIFKD